MGGEILTFRWKEFGAVAREFYNEDEMATLKKVIADSAWTREDHLFEKIHNKAR